MAALFRLLSILLLLSVLSAEDALAQRFELVDGSHYLEGCISGLCLCPIQITMGMQGRMSLTSSGEGEFKLREIRWEVLNLAKPLIFTGEGSYAYRGEGSDREQRMVLELSANNGELVGYDSGWVPLRNESNGIDIYLPMIDIVCYGRAFQLVARPQSAAATDSRSWAAIKAIW